jgi:hypothetical protein
MAAALSDVDVIVAAAAAAAAAVIVDQGLWSWQRQ